MASSDLSKEEKAGAIVVNELLVNNLPKKVKGFAAKLMIGVYDCQKQKLDAQRTYTIELMQTNSELFRDDIIPLLNAINRRAEDALPGAPGQIADQGIL